MVLSAGTIYSKELKTSSQSFLDPNHAHSSPCGEWCLPRGAGPALSPLVFSSWRAWEEFAAGWEKGTCSKSDGSVRTELQTASRLSVRSLGKQAVLHDSTYPSLSPCCHQRKSRRQRERENAMGRRVEDSKRGGLSWCDRAWTRHGDRHTWERKWESAQAVIEKTGNRCGGSLKKVKQKWKFCHYLSNVMSLQTALLSFFRGNEKKFWS